MYSKIHEHHARESADQRARRAAVHVPRPAPPPGRLRGMAALALASLAGRLDRERARRALAS
ncbi:MAG: hypothetical protein MUC84_04665 [Solirubrobacteraceae bacterium]|jgi:hypothetical protein|nr:hypothetical protein [Solirubrobacteraceae bacterium]MCU0313337.1 hypothetical protein [Solirubrobacteraceae bacterium]